MERVMSAATISPSSCPIYPESTMAACSASITHTGPMSAITWARQIRSALNYLATANRFYREVEALRRSYED